MLYSFGHLMQLCCTLLYSRGQIFLKKCCIVLYEMLHSFSHPLMFSETRNYVPKDVAKTQEPR